MVSVLIQVSRSTVIASILGGSTQTASSYSSYTFDASSSSNLDYPGSSLTYVWSCVMTSPTFGSACTGLVGYVSSNGNGLLSVSTLNPRLVIPGGLLDPGLRTPSVSSYHQP
jgi:hypothetical protein